MKNFFDIERNTIKDDKKFIRELLQLSITQLRKMFNELKEDENDTINGDIFIKYIMKNPSSLWNKNKRKKENDIKNWRRN